MGARTRRFTSLASGSGKATAVVVCAVMLIAGCGGSGESTSEVSAPVIRGDVAGAGCEAAKNSWTATAAVGGVTRTVVFTAPTYTSPWTTFTATANSGQNATISSSSSIGSIQVRGLTKKANNTFIVTGTTANGCTYTSPPSITVSGVVEAVAAPGVPTISTVTAGDAKVTVTVAAATTGGTAASYAVTASPAVTGGACTVTGESGSCDVTGLSNGTAYTFTATATNAGGTSAVSAPSAPVTPVTVPGAPTIGAVVAAGSTSTSATVAFTEPASNGGSAITKYTATSDTGSITGTVSQAGSGTITVTGLTAGTPYTFTVTATNAAGTSTPSSPSAQVTILGPPGAPGIGAVAAAGSTSATVAFTAPASNGGSTITQYTATSIPGGITGTVSQSGSGSIRVTRLTTGTSYKFIVTAKNAVGTSAASGESGSVVPALAPGTPAIGAVTVTGSTSVTVAFTAPASNGGSPITQYTATSESGGITGTVSQSGSGSVTLTGLTAGTSYRFRVKASNAVGTSGWSGWSTSVKPGIGNCKAPAGANVNWAYCDKTDIFLRSANLTGANLTGADLTNADLDSANLTGANLTGAYLDNAYLGGANLAGANLVGTRLNGANLTSTNFTDANLTNAALQWTRANQTNFTRANLSGVNLANSDMTGGVLTSATLTGVTWTGVRCPNEKVGPYPCTDRQWAS